MNPELRELAQRYARALQDYLAGRGEAALQEAYDRLEIVEHSAQITHAARALGPVAPLPEPEVQKLQDIARMFGIPQPPETCAICNACPNGHGGPVALGGPPPGAASQAETDEIVAAVIKRLQG